MSATLPSGFASRCWSVRSSAGARTGTEWAMASRSFRSRTDNSPSEVATALVNNALLLSANLSDFERFGGLQVENWLD